LSLMGTQALQASIKTSVASAVRTRGLTGSAEIVKKGLCSSLS
jgi:hypothetical protein